MSSKSLKMSKGKQKNKQQKDESIDGVDEASHKGDEDYVSKKHVYDVMKVQGSMFLNSFEFMLTSVNNRIDGVIKDLTELKYSHYLNLLPSSLTNLFLSNHQVHHYETRQASQYRPHFRITDIKRFSIF